MIGFNSKIYVAGHNGMVGSSIVRKLKKKGYKKILTRSRRILNLLDQKKVYNFLKKYKPDLVIVCAARVGGINDNSQNKHSFLFENLQIQNNLIHGSYLSKIKNLIFLGSSCIYPKNCKQPISENYLLKGELEETNDAYALAKITGLKMCEYYSKKYNLNYKTIMPPNLYGPNDNYDLKNSHFYAALFRKIFECKKNNKSHLNIWGSGKVRRELMFVDDFSDAVIFFMKKKIRESFINIGVNKDFTILEYARKIMKNFNIKLKIKRNLKYPDGVKRKLLDLKIAKSYGWEPKKEDALAFEKTYSSFLKQLSYKRL